MRSVPVTIVEDARDEVWLSGPTGSAEVIVQGQDFVKDGQKVRVDAVRRRQPLPQSYAEVAEDMPNPVDYAISHARLTLATLLFLLVAGFFAYVSIPKEAEPDVAIPIIYVNVTQRGISPEDAERLILRPLETQLKSVENVKEMRSAAFEGGGYVLLEFEAGFDSDVGHRRRARQGRRREERSAARRRRAAGRRR